MKKNNGVKKAIIAAAGYGTRFLPATKDQPKEMLPVIDKPIIQYLVEEAVSSGIKDIIIVTRYGQMTLENHFDSNLELEVQLEKSEKHEALKKVRKAYRMANFVYVRQGRHLPYGNATPLLCVRNLIAKGESFVYMFGDDLVLSKKPCAGQLIDYSKKRKGSPIIAVQEVDKSEVSRYGVIELVKGSEDRVAGAVEKPEPKDAPSNLAQFGRFVLNREIADIAYEKYTNKEYGKGNELWLLDCILSYTKNKPVYAARIEGEWMTTGDPLRYMKTQVQFAIKRSDIGPEFRSYLKSLKL